MWSAAITAAAVVFLAVLLAGAAAPAQAGPPEDAVIDWNAYASDALINAPIPATPGVAPGVGEWPPVASIGFAIMHGAIYDAVNMIDGGYKPYLDDLPAASANASKPAAVATAAHDVLVGVVRGIPLVPPLAPPLTSDIADDIVDRLDDLRDDSLDAIPDSSAKTNGIAAGAAAAQEMLRVRAGGSPGSSPSCSRASRSSERKGHIHSRVAPMRRSTRVKELGGNGTTTPTTWRGRTA
jgi:hypothetical protein